MGRLNNNNKVLMFLLTTHIVFFCLVCCKSSAARPLLMNDLNPRNLAATDPAFNVVTTQKLGGIYGSLVLNALPKGRTPASGPSRRNNDINI